MKKKISIQKKHWKKKKKKKYKEYQKNHKIEDKLEFKNLNAQVQSAKSKEKYLNHIQKCFDHAVPQSGKFAKKAAPPVGKSCEKVIVAKLLTECANTFPTVVGENASNCIVKGYTTIMHIGIRKLLDLRSISKDGYRKGV